jgi:hypothetical protein
MTALLAVVHPNNWGGAVVIVITVLGSIAAIALLFGWDDPQRTQADRDRDILKGPLG